MNQVFEPYETAYAFTAYNTEAQYGYGTQSEAQAYCEWLNRDRDVHHYEWEAVAMTDEEADAKCFSLPAALIEIEAKAREIAPMTTLKPTDIRIWAEAGNLTLTEKVGHKPRPSGRLRLDSE